eukprot:9174535-Alexandrium_andersonii.AAC.1
MHLQCDVPGLVEEDARLCHAHLQAQLLQLIPEEDPEVPPCWAPAVERLLELPDVARLHLRLARR